MNFYSMFPAILLLAIGGVTFAVYRLRAVAVADSKRVVDAQNAQDTLYGCSRKLEDVNKRLQADDVAGAYRVYLEAARSIGQCKRELFSSIEWKNFLEQTLESVNSFENYFSMNHGEAAKEVKKMVERERVKAQAEADRVTNIWVLSFILVVCSIPLVVAIFFKMFRS